MGTWLEDWRLIEDEVRALNHAILAFTNTVEHVNRGIYNELSSRTLLPALRSTIDRARVFHQEHAAVIPSAAAVTLSQLLDEGSSQFAQVAGLGGSVLLSTWLSTVCTRVTSHLQDRDAQHAHVAERAFLHLQRLIVVDPGVRRRWQQAFKSGEVACERLGGCHLLHHGIYGVKANSAGERTDLILGTKLIATSTSPQ